MSKLSIIFANRKDCFEKPGGDTIQMNKTKEYLEKEYPVEIKICLTPQEILQNKDAKIVHIFNLETVNETNAFIDAAKKMNKKIVLSTIHWSLLDNYYAKYLGALNLPPVKNFKIIKLLLILVFNLFISIIPSFRSKYKNYIDKGLYGTCKYKSLRKRAINAVDLLIPNSTEELLLCAKDFDLDLQYLQSKSYVIPNATDFTNDNEYDNSFFESLNLPHNYVLTVGRIECAKNQYNVIKALMKHKDIGIVIVGAKENQKAYNNLVKLSKKRGNVFFIDHIEQKFLKVLYKNALCHCLPTFCDTTGLVNIEALLCNCPIVISNNQYCPTNYYEFDKYGIICDPYSTKSIENAIFKVINQKKEVNLTHEYKYKISYKNVANKTFEQYKILMESTD